MLPKEQFSLTVPKFFHSPAYFHNSPLAVWDLTLTELAPRVALSKSLRAALVKLHTVPWEPSDCPLGQSDISDCPLGQCEPSDCPLGQSETSNCPLGQSETSNCPLGQSEGSQAMVQMAILLFLRVCFNL